jgi:hypothetical protein
MHNKLIFILIFIFSSGFANAEWIKVGTNASAAGVGVDFFYDNSRIEILKPSDTKNGKTYLRIATLDNYHKPTNHYQLGKMVNSAVEFRLYDCSSTRTRIDRIVYLLANMTAAICLQIGLWMNLEVHGMFLAPYNERYFQI